MATHSLQRWIGTLWGARKTPHDAATTRHSSGLRGGFTLIELLAVMGIIVALSLVVAGGYSGISRAIARGQASRQVRDALLLARQTACVNGATVYFYVLSEDEFVICRKIGTSSKKTQGQASYQEGEDAKFKKGAYEFSDFYTDLSGFVNEIDRLSEASGMGAGSSQSVYYGADMSGKAEIFDFSSNEAKYGILRGVETIETGMGWNLYWVPAGGNAPSDIFAPGHDYGVALHPIRSLPKGYVFLDDPGTCIYFEPTGTAGPGSGKQTLTMAEYALKNNPKHQHTVSVTRSGKISIEDMKE